MTTTTTTQTFPLVCPPETRLGRIVDSVMARVPHDAWNTLSLGGWEVHPLPTIDGGRKTWGWCRPHLRQIWFNLCVINNLADDDVVTALVAHEVAHAFLFDDAGAAWRSEEATNALVLEWGFPLRALVKAAG